MKIRILAFAAVVLTATLVHATPTPLQAQSGLEEVDRLTRLGRTEAARVALADWWGGDRSQASRRDLQRGLWLRGRLTVDPVQAELEFQRLVVLYPSGPFTPDAILRLAQASWAMGDEAAARSYVGTLERDHPRSDALEAAERWLADAGPVPPPADMPTRAAPGPGERRADALSSSERERAQTGEPQDDEAGAVEPGTVDPTMNYYVQLGAFAERERAMALYDSVRARGVDVRVVRVEGSQFTHVRVGRFAQRASAVELLEELAAQGIGAALVRDDRAEEPIGG